MSWQSRYKDFMNQIKRKNPGETEFHQAVDELVKAVFPYIEGKRQFDDWAILDRMTEPDRVISFRVTWEDDKGKVHVNRGYRVQFSNAIGPYKGGLRFHPSVNLSILKFLAFEQVFKNSLTTLPIGGGKGGSDFDPKGKSDREVMRFCQAFMDELARHIGPDVDVPAGDIGVGAREVGYLYGQYKRIKNDHTGVLTGKDIVTGGSQVRKEATGFGCVYFVEEMLKRQKLDLDGLTCVISGSGNVAQYTAKKLIELGGKVVTLSDSSGFIYDKDGLTDEKLAWVIDLKEKRRGRIEEYAKQFGVEYFKDQKPWAIPCDLAFPSATQNEINVNDAKELAKNGCKVVAEGANMPTEVAGAEVFHQAKVLFAPSKAANAGGVAMSALEMTQNSMRLSWNWEELDNRLKAIMRNIHEQCIQYGNEGVYVDYLKGANIAGFNKVATAMMAYGIV